MYYRLATPTGSVPKPHLQMWLNEVLEETSSSPPSVRSKALAYAQVLRSILGPESSGVARGDGQGSEVSHSESLSYELRKRN